MELIKWDDSLTTGIPLIDAQHKVLVGKLNKLNACLEGDKVCDNLNVLLDELLEYTYYHFDTEEEFFVEFSYENQEEHVKQHDGFRRYLKEFLSKKGTDEKVLSEDLLNFLKKWIEHHIKDVDMAYVSFLKDKINL